MSLKLAVSRASSSEPSTGMGRSSPVAATRSVASVSCCTGRRPVRATAAPASAASATPDAADRRQRDAEPGQHGAGGVEPLPDHQRAALPASTATTRYCTRPSVAVRTDDRGLAAGHRQLLLAQRRRRRRAPADCASPFS